MFGLNVRTLRQRLGLSQEDLARCAGVDVKTIRMIESGRRVPRPSTLRQLADALTLNDTDREAFYLQAASVGATPATLANAGVVSHSA